MTDDPLEPNRRAIVAKTTRLKDPTHIDALKAAEESSMLGTENKIQGLKSQKLCKETLPVELWASGKIEATPYGTYARMMKNKKASEGSPIEKKKSLTMQSHIMFDHFNYPTGKKE